MTAIFETEEKTLELAIKGGYTKEDFKSLDEFDLSMLLDGYTKDEILELRRMYF
jgi:hypothetical protein